MTKSEETKKPEPKLLPFERIAVKEDHESGIFNDIDQASLWVLAPVIGRACVEQNKAYIRSKAKDENPANSVVEGINVHRCVNRVYDDFKDQPEFEEYKSCLVRKSFYYDYCLKEKKNFKALVERTKYREQSPQ